MKRSAAVLVVRSLIRSPISVRGYLCYRTIITRCGSLDRMPTAAMSDIIGGNCVCAGSRLIKWVDGQRRCFLSARLFTLPHIAMLPVPCPVPYHTIPLMFYDFYAYLTIAYHVSYYSIPYTRLFLPYSPWQMIMDLYVQRTHGTYVVNKGSAILWQFRDADPEFGWLQSKELEDHLTTVLKPFR